MKTSY